MWCQVEIETDGGILGRISPFVAMSLVPQMTPYHYKLSITTNYLVYYILYPLPKTPIIGLTIT